MKHALTKIVIVACLAGSALASAKTDDKVYDKTFFGDPSSHTYNFKVDTLSNVSIGYSWSDIVVTRPGTILENNATSLTWFLEVKPDNKGPYSFVGSDTLADPVGNLTGSGTLQFQNMAAGHYKLKLIGEWDNSVTVSGTKSDLQHWSESGGKVKLVESSLSVTAVPEPETYAMLLAGLGLMGAVARRRRKA